MTQPHTVDEILAQTVAEGNRALREAADVASVNPADPAFRDRVIEKRQQAFDRAVGRLSKALTRSVLVLQDLAMHGRTGQIKLAAARTILEFGLKYRDLVELDARLTALEKARKAREARKG
jgi:hypothetical protein